MDSSVKSILTQNWTKNCFDNNFVKMIVIFTNYYGTFLVVRLEKPINLMRPRTTFSMFQLFYTQSAFCTLIHVLYRGPRFIPSPQSLARSQFLYVGILDWQKIFLVRQRKDFSTNKKISRPTKLISHPINIFIEPRRHSLCTAAPSPREKLGRETSVFYR